MTSNTSNRAVVPEAKDGLNQFKTEVANEIGVPLKDYNGDLASRDAGRIGGTMVKRMIETWEREHLTR